MIAYAHVHSKKVKIYQQGPTHNSSKKIIYLFKKYKNLYHSHDGSVRLHYYNKYLMRLNITHHNDGIAVVMDLVPLPSESKLLQSQQQPQNGVPLLLGIVREMRPVTPRTVTITNLHHTNNLLVDVELLQLFLHDARKWR